MADTQNYPPTRPYLDAEGNEIPPSPVRPSPVVRPSAESRPTTNPSSARKGETLPLVDIPDGRGGQAWPRIPGYNIRREIATGGMGTVYEAEQYSPRRSVALKVVRAGVTTPDLLRRFEFEAHVLGLLRHPGIAQIYEAGTFDVGHGPQPFFAMEFVDGRPLNEYVRATQPPLRDRVILLIRICDAVQHAHQKGIIHRDLKPQNILVDSEGQPKILDFGLARATDADLRSSSYRTEVGRLIGTVVYMSPEQAHGRHEEMDTRSDVYTLGVIAFEVLAGRLPYNVDTKQTLDILRAIREDEPSRLSSTNKAYRGDLETIIGKALEKEMERRYASASSLASDFRRWLDGEPIAARPPGHAYLVRKFVSRNKSLVATAAGFILMLHIGLAATTWQARQAEIARAEAEELRRLASIQAERAEADAMAAQVVAEFLVGAFENLDPRAMAAALPALFQVLNEAAGKVEADLAGQPTAQAFVLHTLGNIYGNMGFAPRAEEMLTKSLEIWRREFGDAHSAVPLTLNDLGVIQQGRGKLDEAESLHREALRLREEIYGGDTPEVYPSLANLADTLTAQGRTDDAAPYRKRAEAILKEHPDLARPAAQPSSPQEKLRQLLRHIHKDGDVPVNGPFLRNRPLRDRETYRLYKEGRNPPPPPARN